jgi:HK97 family phage portal protein
LESGRLRYRYSGDHGAVVMTQEECLHIRASSEDGLIGRSPIAIARGALGLAVALSDVAGNIAANGLRPAAVLQHPGKLSPQAKASMAGSFEEKSAGPGNAGKILVLEEGMTWAAAAFSAEDQELLESRKLSNEDVARIFGVPPASVGISNSVSYGSAQQAAADLVQNCLAPLAQRVEQAMMRCLLSAESRRTFFIEHDLSGLLRGDPTQRWGAYKTGREIGALSAREIRRFENLGPMDPADDYTPLKATPATAEPIATVKP